MIDAPPARFTDEETIRRMANGYIVDVLNRIRNSPAADKLALLTAEACALEQAAERLFKEREKLLEERINRGTAQYGQA